MQVEIFIRYADVLIELGPRRFRRFVTDIFPHPHLQRVKDVIDTMDEKSRAIFREKETALENGDKAVLHQVGEGKDIMSVFSTFMHIQDSPDVLIHIQSKQTMRHQNKTGFPRMS